ncbi:hypothetical protein PFICI_11324 [Pestalotiopsis fici W106-1]|uniref:A-kinase anchor protein 7-like phosphoesterase domain-containing protein n=1 Tax=Pestalotiopsis fici (strain W106-1 / CGMCC3.15140) TaxID=1229662 RepID=W3WUC4_PESFW|nr:uncharacterized protein PFICI_11324 [Pestalotiopsis fici W106-1]ETS77450.1 hypothetical protein PFICI_11324 [Pestalotiopsis fici W106-1]
MPPKPFPTHFLCIPLVTATSRHQLAASLASFSADVTSPDSFAVPAGAIRPVGTLHLTLGVMSFPRNEGVDKAVELLQTLTPAKMLSEARAATMSNAAAAAAAIKGQGKVVGGQKDSPAQPLLSVTLKGLHSMQSASKASTLYSSPVDADGALQRFCEKLKAAFEEAGFMMSDKRPLLLHATIVNTIYIKGRRHQGGGKKREKITIDARGILDRYEDNVWMENVPIEKIAICRMGAKETEDGQDQAYEVEAEIDVDGTT